MSAAATVLLVEDDPDLAEIVRLKAESFAIRVEVVSDGKAGLECALSQDFSLVILDINLPRLSGIDICRELRAKKAGLPILMLTSLSDESDVVLGLELGADDYVTKPFRPRELISRMRGLLDRNSRLRLSEVPSATEPEMRNRKGLHVDLLARSVFRDGECVDCTSLEWELLAVLAKTPNRVFTREELIDRLWGDVSGDSEPPLNRLVCRLRKKLECDPTNPRHIITVFGVGYRWGE